MSDGWSMLRRCILEGRSDAREELYERLRSLGSLSPHFVSEDEFCSELYLRVVGRLLDTGAGTSIDEIRCIKAYCRGAARNLRQVMISERSKSPLPLTREPPVGTGAEPHTRRRELAAALEEAVSGLTAWEREVLWMADGQKMTPREIIDTYEQRGMSLTRAGVYTRLARGRRRLRRALVKAGYDPASVRRWLGLLGSALLVTLIAAWANVLG